jgi:hypothetical protein
MGPARVTKLGTAEENAIRIALGARARHTRLFRNFVGYVWSGRLIRHDKAKRIVELEFAQPVNAGLAPGSADLVGVREIIVTSNMVGQKIAVFTSLEVKSGAGRPTTEQVNWREFVLSAGGLAAVVRSPDEAVSAVSEPFFGVKP